MKLAVKKLYPQSWVQKESPHLCETANRLHDDEREGRMFEALAFLYQRANPEHGEYAMKIMDGRINIGS